MIQLGSRAKDMITGFKGIVLGRAEYLTGCNQVLIVPEGLDKDGRRQDGEWLDEQRVKQLAGKPLVLQNGAHPGLDERLPPTR